MLFDVTLFTGKPPPPHGIGLGNGAAVIYGGDGTIWNDQKSLTAAVTAAVAAGAAVLCLDNESSPLQVLMQNVQWARAAAPDLKIGIFGQPWWQFFDPAEKNQAVNDANQELLSILDIAMPGAYSLFGLAPPGQFAAWQKNLMTMIGECGFVMAKKPIYPFLTMYYPDIALSNQGQLLESPFFLQQAQICQDHAQGAMIWSGPAAWDPRAAWYHDLLRAGILNLGPAAAEQLAHGMSCSAALINELNPGR